MLGDVVARHANIRSWRHFRHMKPRCTTGSNGPKMKTSGKNKLLITNGLYWLAAILVPAVINLIPVSHPPKILPLFIYGFMFALAGASTWMWNKAIVASPEE